MQITQQFVRSSRVKQACALMVGAVAMLALAWSASATLNVVAWYKLGEADTPTPTINGQAGNATTVNSIPGGLDLTKHGSVAYSTDVSPVSGDPITRVASTWSMQFTHAGQGYYQGPSLASNLTSNVGVELWLKPSVANETQDYALWNGNVLTAAGSGYGFFQSGTKLVARVMGVTQKNVMTLQLGQWTDVAMVFDSTGAATVYTNGFVATTFAAGMIAPDATSDPYFFSLGTAGDAGHTWDGWIDNVRVFTFTGTFNPNELLLIVPEPSTIMLFGLGGGLLWLRRRNQRRAA